MSDEQQNPKVFSIAELFAQSADQKYLIPLYQRNYSWGKAEVRQLLDDVKDMALQHKESSQTTEDKEKSSSYYLGSLVVSQRTSGEYELIDGQQRFTTLTIILAAIKATLSGGKIIGADKLKDSPVSEALAVLLDPVKKLKQNLRFESRPESQQAIKDLFERHVSFESNCRVSTITSAYQEVKKFLKELTAPSAKQSDSEKKTLPLLDFVQYLLEHTKLLRTPVPKETDLNHYFEIMNNRGEQLEKHEILKAQLMGMLKGSDSESDKPLSLSQEQTGFAQIWDACAEMDRYLVMSFESKRRILLFGENMDRWPDNFAAACSTLIKKTNETDNTSERTENDLEFVPSLSLKALIEKPEFTSKAKRHDKSYQGAFTGIINFPNFLLQVLRVWSGTENKQSDHTPQLCLDTDITLDDKKLLDAFESIKTAEQVRSFAHILLVCRLLLDRYVIKRKSDEKWTLKQIKKNSNDARTSDTYSDVNTFGSEQSGTQDNDKNQQLVMILSMFHVSFPGQSRKYWLSAVLGYLYQQKQKQKQDNTVELEGEAYLKFLEQLSDHLFFGRFYTQSRREYDELLGSLASFEIAKKDGSTGEREELTRNHLNCGTHTENFIFNRLDYLLWKRLVVEKALDKEGFVYGNRDYIKEKLKEFSFTARSSVEHYYPQQAKGEKFPGDEKIIGKDGEQTIRGVDRFGNLCLISQSLNSQLSNDGYEDKKRIFENSSATESLKQLLMMSYKKWGPDMDDKQDSPGMDNVETHEKSMIDVLCSSSEPREL